MSTLPLSFLGFGCDLELPEDQVSLHHDLELLELAAAYVADTAQRLVDG
ncbi:MAG: hypothetical protein AAGF01_26405 [Cyanobacteria bacterium P01_G01_bin.38]